MHDTLLERLNTTIEEARSPTDDILGQFKEKPEAAAYTSIGHADNANVSFWVWKGNTLRVVKGKGAGLHTDHFPEEWFMYEITYGRVFETKGSMNYFPRTALMTIVLKRELRRRFPRVRTFYVNHVHNPGDLLDEARYTWARQSYPNKKYGEDRPALKASDSVRVFHGFHNLADAINACKYGLSGATRVGRRYSYESNNNPRGLFVATSIATTHEFGKYSIEFVARVSELETPVWPGKSYTVQGQMSQDFTKDNPRHKAVAQADTDAVASGKENLVKSDKPGLMHSLAYRGEGQALFVAHLRPNRIVRVWRRPEYQEKLAPMSVAQFLKSVKNDAGSKNAAADKLARGRFFNPEDVFDPIVFVEKLGKKYKSREAMKSLMPFFTRLLKEPGAGNFRYAAEQLEHWMWPKQIPRALIWMARLVREKSGEA